MPFSVSTYLNDQLTFLRVFKASIKLCRQPWWREMPEWLLTLLMPFVALQTLPYFFSPRTFRRHPGFVFTEWLARARNKPWVVQATGKQVQKFIGLTKT